MDLRQKPVIYEIQIKGFLDQRWQVVFDVMEISSDPNGETILRGEMDQSALFGVLNRIHDLGMQLIFVRIVNENKNIQDQGKSNEII